MIERDKTKVRFIFKKVKYVDFKSPTEALKAQQNVGIVITYTVTSNHIFTAVFELPNFISKIITYQWLIQPIMINDNLSI